MGKARDQANMLFDALEKELTEVAKAGGRDVKLRKKWRLGMMSAAAKRGLTIKQLIDEVRPGIINSIRQANSIDPAVLHPNGEGVGFVITGPDVKTRH